MQSKTPRCVGSYVTALDYACQPQAAAEHAHAGDFPTTDAAMASQASSPSSSADPASSPDERDPSEARRLRLNLVSQIAARREVRSERVLQALRDVPRHLFVDGVALELAYSDRPLPIGDEQTISQPTIVAIMTDALELTGLERVLEIGTGSGYQAAILSRLAREVYSMELLEGLGHRAQQRLSKLGYGNVYVHIGNGYGGWPDQAPFDRIVLTAAPTQVPRILFDELSDRGILVAPVGTQHGDQMLYRFRKRAGAIEKENLGGVRFVPMVTGTQGL